MSYLSGINVCFQTPGIPHYICSIMRHIRNYQNPLKLVAISKDDKRFVFLYTIAFDKNHRNWLQGSCMYVKINMLIQNELP